MGFYSHTEYHTSNGRIDLLLETPQYRYIMKFKLDGIARQALEQIKAKDYDLQYQLDGKVTYLVGVNFSKETRKIEQWEIEERN